MRKTITLLLLLCFAAIGYSQENNTSNTTNSENKQTYVFTESKDLDAENKVVYFCISNIKSEQHKTEIMKSLKKMANASFVRIYKDLYGYDRCQLNINIKTTADDIREILKENDTDFSFVSVKERKK